MVENVTNVSSLENSNRLDLRQCSVPSASYFLNWIRIKVRSSPSLLMWSKFDKIFELYFFSLLTRTRSACSSTEILMFKTFFTLFLVFKSLPAKIVVVFKFLFTYFYFFFCVFPLYETSRSWKTQKMSEGSKNPKTY